MQYVIYILDSEVADKIGMCSSCCSTFISTGVSCRDSLPQGTCTLAVDGCAECRRLELPLSSGSAPFKYHRMTDIAETNNLSSSSITRHVYNMAWSRMP